MMAHGPSTVSTLVLGDSMEMDDDIQHSVDATDGPYSPGSPDNKTCKKKGKQAGKQQYNRTNIDMMKFLTKNADDIAAKPYRTLIPMMFQKLLHPDKDLQKTKVKGLWDAGNKPHDWDEELPEVTFKDPNNAPKLKLEDNKKIFSYLKKKLLELPEIRRALYIQQEPHKGKHGRYNHHMVAPFREMPNLAQFSSHLKQEPRHLAQFSSHLKQEPDYYENEAVSHETGFVRYGLPLAKSPDEQSYRDNPAIPAVVHDVLSDEAALAQDQGIKIHQFRQTEEAMEGLYQHSRSSVVPMHEADSTSNVSTLVDYLGPTPSEPVRVLCDQVMPDGNRITELAILHTYKSEPQTPMEVHSLCVESDEDTRRPIAPEGSELPDTTATGTINGQCAAFVQEIYSSLITSLQEHWKMFSQDVDVIQQTQVLMKVVLEPLKMDAMQSKDHCLKLDEFSSKFQTLLKHARIKASLQDTFCTDDLVKELQLLQVEYLPHQNLHKPVPETLLQDMENEVPEIGHEVVIMRAEMDGKPPVLQDQQNYHIPTVEQILARAEYKACVMEPEYFTGSLPYFETGDEIEKYASKTRKEPKSPFLQQKSFDSEYPEKDAFSDSILSPTLVNGMEFMDLDPEKDFGVALKEEIQLQEEKAEVPSQMLDEIGFTSQEEIKLDFQPGAHVCHHGAETDWNEPSYSCQSTPDAFTFSGDLSGGPGLNMSTIQIDSGDKMGIMGSQTSMEDHAVNSLLVDAQKHFGGSMVTQHPMLFNKNPAFSDHDSLDQYLVDFILDSEVSPNIADMEINNPQEIVTESATMPLEQDEYTETSSTSLSPDIKTESSPRNASFPEFPTVLPLSQCFNPRNAIIPLTVFEKAGAPDDLGSPPRKRALLNKHNGGKSRSTQQKKPWVKRM